MRCEIVCNGTHVTGAGNGLNTCACAFGYGWETGSKTCIAVVTCTGPYISGPANGVTTCSCVSGFAWSLTNSRCEFNCSQDAYATGLSSTVDVCNCIPGFAWSSTNKRCEILCSGPNVAGAGNGVSTCNCTSGYSWNAVNRSCVQVGSTTGWTTNGNIILNNGVPYKLKSVSWFGFETTNLVLHGLWQVSMESILDKVKNLGFNSLRIPWCDNIISNPATNSINYGANPNLVNKNSLDVLDYLVDRCT